MIFWILYILLGAGHVFAIYMQLPGIAITLKFLLLPVLMLAFRFSFKGHLSPIAKGILIAQLFSWFGDILLIRSSVSTFFLVGLIAFLFSHLAYILSFRKEISSKAKEAIMINNPWMVLPFVAFGILIISRMWGGLGTMKLPVALYTTVIMAMLTMSFNRLKLVSDTSFLLVLIGAALFVASDTMIAVNRFIQPFEGSREAIMSTYIIAQIMIAGGMTISLGGKVRS